MAYLNDEKISINSTLLELIEEQGYDKEKIVVLVNGEIVKREFWNKVNIDEEDYIEVISFVGGG